MIKTKTFQLFILTLVLPVLFGEPAQAGTFVKAIRQSYTQKTAYAYVMIYIDKGKLKADIQGPSINGTFYYDQATSQMDWADHSKKTCLELAADDQAMIKVALRLGATAFARQLAEETNPDRKKQFEEDKRLLQSLLDKPASTGVPFSGFTCDKYAGDEGGKKISELWLTRPTLTAMATEDWNTYRSLIDAAMSLFEDFLTVMDVDAEKVKQGAFYHELPIGEMDYAAGSPNSVTRVLQVQTQTLTPGIFDLPAG